MLCARRSNRNECSENFNLSVSNEDHLLAASIVGNESECSASLGNNSDEIHFDKRNHKINGTAIDNKLDDLPIDHQLTVTWDNLQEILIAVRGKCFYVARKAACF